MVGGTGGLPPPWLRGEMEAPQGEKDMGGRTAAVFTQEQQARLGVNEQGQKISNSASNQQPGSTEVSPPLTPPPPPSSSSKQQSTMVGGTGD